MSEQIRKDVVQNSHGQWSISTIRTDAGGAMRSGECWMPFSSADYEDENPWPFETMVFQGGMTGKYHEPYASLKDAKAGHERIKAALMDETLEIGKGVAGPFGTPSITAKEWFDLHPRKQKKRP